MISRLHRHLAAFAALALLALPASAATVRFDLGGVVGFNNLGLPDNLPFTATAEFDADVPLTRVAASGSRVFEDALTGLSLTLGGETVTARVPGLAIQGAPGGPQQFFFRLGALDAGAAPAVDEFDGTIAGRELRYFSGQSNPSRPGSPSLFTTGETLLDAVSAGAPVTFGPDVMPNLTLIFDAVGDGPDGFALLVVQAGTITRLSTAVPEQPAPVPLPASGLLLLGAIGALVARRRMG